MAKRAVTLTLIGFALLSTLLVTDAQGQDYYYAESVSNPLSINYTAEGTLDTLTWFKYSNPPATDQTLFKCAGSTGTCSSFGNALQDYTLQQLPPQYNLVIHKLTALTSVKYWTNYLTDSSEINTNHYVIGLEPLTCPDSGQTVMEGTAVEFTCTATYYQYLIESGKIVRPVLTWYNDLGTDFNELAENNETSIQSFYTINVTLTGDYDDVMFTCNLTFAPGTGLEYEDFCEFSYFVTHGVSNVDVGLSTDNGVPTFRVGETINCTSNGRPEPNITWIDENGNQLSDSAILEITPELLSFPQPVTCSCVSWNIVDGVTYESSANATFTVSASEVIVMSGGVEAWVIAVAVVVPVVVLTAAGIGGYFFYRHRKNKKDKKKKPTNGSARSASNYTAVNTNPDPYPPRAPQNVIYSAPAAAPRMTPTAGSGSNTPAGAGGYGALGVQYYTGSNNALNASISSHTPSTQPAYSYNPRQGAPPVSMNPNPSSRPTPLPPPGNPSYPYTSRQPSVASSVSSRSSHNGGGPVVVGYASQTRPSQASSRAGSQLGSEV